MGSMESKSKIATKTNIGEIRETPLHKHIEVVDATCHVIGGDAECPLQVCQLSRSLESTHFLVLSRDVALFVSPRVRDSL